MGFPFFFCSSLRKNPAERMNYLELMVSLRLVRVDLAESCSVAEAKRLVCMYWTSGTTLLTAHPGLWGGLDV